MAVCLMTGGQQSFSAPRPGQSLAAANTLTSPADSLTVSLITCYPGAEIFELCGHEAIRIRSQKMDSVWNYGLFDFNAPGFIYRFVKGETDYMLGGYPFAWFIPEYVQAGRKVVEQDLNLTQPEARRLLQMLRHEQKPENRVYRYNYVLDNCATRPLQRIDQAVAPTFVIYPDTLCYGTFRREMKAMHAGYPWYQFGIDLVLGSGLDRRLEPRQEMFVPMVLMERAEQAHLSDGRPLVSNTRVLNPGSTNATLPPTPWWKSPLMAASILCLICLITAFADIRRQSIFKPTYSFYYLLTGIAGLVVWFLILFSSHEATSPNALRWWLSPLALVPAVSIWFPCYGGLITSICIWLETIGAALLLMLWPVLPQASNIAIFPLLACAIILGIAYTIVTSKKRLSDNNNLKPARQAHTPTSARTHPRKKK